MGNTVIAKQFCLSLKCFFKDCFKYWDDCYLIPFYNIQFFQKQYSDFIKSSCDCSKQQSCHGCQFLQFVNLILLFEQYSVIKKRVYFKYFLFKNFKLTNETKPKIKRWQVIGIFDQDLNKLTYSERLSFLAFKK